MEQQSDFDLEQIKLSTDRSTFSNYNDVRTTHLHFDWYVNFDSSALEGAVTLKMHVEKEIQTVILDTWNLHITTVTLVRDDNSKEITYKIAEDTDIGNKMEIDLGETLAPSTNFALKIEYSSDPGSNALSWLKPDQTLEKQYPYLFSQSEPIYARAIFPCQDTPSIKTPYTATVKVKSPMTVLLSADVQKETKSEDGEFNIVDFKMDMPIPSYLVSIAAGNIAFRKIGERCGIYAEGSYVDTCAAEFEDMEKFLKVGEELLFEYPLKNYFVIILPPSMPYGGMENPITTFATPTIVVGDKSAVNVVCHEIAHSWTGNYLTNSSWEDFWLNEGFTRYIEAKMIQKLYGDEAHKLHLKEGLSNLQGVLKGKSGKGAGCIMCVDIAEHQNPDDVLGITQYEKGHYLLYYIELLMGEENMFKFLRQYLRKREGGNINTREFVEDLHNFIRETFDADKATEIISKIDWSKWLYDGDLPPVIHETDYEGWHKMQAIFEAYATGTEPEDLDTLKNSTGLMIAFTQKIMLEEDKFDTDKLAKIDEALHISENKNCEILVGWYDAALRLGYEKVFEDVYKFLGEVGRMKFVIPLYKALIAVNKPKAQELFEQYKTFYHAICRGQVEKVLK